MFKILVVLLVGAFIASHARPYLPQHLEHRVHKRDVTKVIKLKEILFHMILSISIIISLTHSVIIVTAIS